MIRVFQVYVFLAYATLAASAATVTASLDRDTAAVGDSVRLNVRVEGGAPQAVPDFRSQPNLDIQFAGQSSEYRIVNGRASSGVVLTYIVTATQPGAYNIPATRVVVDGATLSTQPLRFVAANDPATTGATPAVFVKIIPGKTNVFVGELFPIEIKVYGIIVDELNHPTLKSDAFTIGKQGQAMRSREQFGNMIYNVFSFPLTVAAAKAGNVNLGPADVQIVYRVPLSGGGRRGGAFDLFDDLMGGGRYQRRQGTISSEPVAMRVLALPTNAPPSFTGAVGDFSLKVSATPTNLTAGDPITLQIAVAGRGLMDLVQLPKFGWRDFSFYDPISTATNTDSFNGVKTFDQVVVPQRGGLSSIPPIEFSFFDPDKKSYRTLRHEAIPIAVRASSVGTAQPTISSGVAPAETPQAQASADIVHIKPVLGQLAAARPPVTAGPFFFVLQLLPLAFWIGAVAWRKNADRLARDPRLRRRIEVENYVARALPELRSLAAANRQEEFFAGVFRLLQESLGERLDLPASAITEAVVDERLPALGASADFMGRLRELFAICNQARYAGVDVEGMEAVIPHLEEAVAEARQLPNQPGGSR